MPSQPPGSFRVVHLGLAVLAAGLVLGCRGQDAEPAAPIDVATATPSPTPSPTSTPTPSPTATASPTPEPTSTPAGRGAAVAQDGGGTSAGAGGAGSFAPARPRPAGVEISRLGIPGFGVSAGMEYLGILPSNELDSPHNPYNVGWYWLYDFPGGPGNAVFSGHVDYYPNIIGPFNQLKNAGIGTSVVVTLTDGTQLQYEVIRNTRYSIYSIPMGEVIWPSDRPRDDEWITLITCGGEFRATTAYGAGEYLHRDVVVARRVK